MEQNRELKINPHIDGQSIFNKIAKTIHWEKGLFNKWCWKYWIFTYKKMNLDSHHTQYLKINSKGIKDLILSGKTLKLLEENIEKNLYAIEFGNNLMEITLKAHATKNKKFDLIKLNHFCGK